MAKKYIEFSHTLEEYNKKYHNYQYRLLRLTKKEVDSFDKKNNSFSKGCLLKGRKWWLINDTFYEVPKAPRYIWFRNLKASVQVATCILGAGVITTAITVPLTLTQHNEPIYDPTKPIIDETISKDVDISFDKKDGDNYLYKVTSKNEEKEVSSIKSVYIGNDLLEINKEYNTIESNAKHLEVTIFAIAFKNHKGQVKILPELIDVEKKIIVTFNSNGGSSIDSQKIEIDTIPTKPTDPIKKGADFVGWYLDNETFLNEYKFDTPLSTNTTLYAKYNNEVYTITYNLNGGTNNPDNPINYTVDDEITLLDPTKEEATFNCWKDENNKAISKISKGSTGNRTITADFTDITYKVTLHSRDESKGRILSGSGDYKKGDVAIAKCEIIGDNYFGGWYTDANYTNKVSTLLAYPFEITGEGDIDLYADFYDDSEWENKHGVNPIFNETDHTVTYGLYPQMVVDSSITVELDKLEPTSPYNYVEYKREYYCKVVCEVSNPGYQFADGTWMINGETYYFRCDPIKWKYKELNDNQYELESCNAIDSTSYRYTNENAAYPNNYKESKVRNYINDVLYNQAFFLNKQKSTDYVIDTVVDNSASTTAYNPNAYACSDTTDKIYLPSYKYMNDTYSTDSQRMRFCSDYTLIKNGYKKPTNNCSRYYTRSPSTNKNNGMFISSILPGGGLNNFESTDSSTLSGFYLGIVPMTKIQIPN